MAERRMFAKTIIDSDAFLEMPQSTQLLYFHLSMRGDDDGFINKPKSIMRSVGCKDDDMGILIAKKFIIPFETGIVVIKHWQIHNYIRRDRYTETKYIDEKSQLTTDAKGAYTALATTCQPHGIPMVNQMDTQVRLGKVRLGKDRLDNIPQSDDADMLSAPPKKSPKKKYGEYQRVLLTDDEHSKLVKDYKNANDLIKFLDEYIEMKGYKAKSHYLAIKKWVVDAVDEVNKKSGKILKSSNPSYDLTEYEDFTLNYIPKVGGQENEQN